MGKIKKVKVKSFSCVQLSATVWIVACQAPRSMEFSRQEYWSGLPFPSPGDLSNPGIEPGSFTLQADALLSEPPGNPIRIKKRSKLRNSFWAKGGHIWTVFSRSELLSKQLSKKWKGPEICRIHFISQPRFVSHELPESISFDFFLRESEPCFFVFFFFKLNLPFFILVSKTSVLHFIYINFRHYSLSLREIEAQDQLWSPHPPWSDSVFWGVL